VEEELAGGIRDVEDAFVDEDFGEMMSYEDVEALERERVREWTWPLRAVELEDWWYLKRPFSVEVSIVRWEAEYIWRWTMSNRAGDESAR
jgi:hypothetical protein